VNEYQTIQAAKKLLAQLGFGTAHYKARWDNTAQHEIRRQNPLMTKEFFEHCYSLVGVIRNARYGLSHRLEVKPGKYQARAIEKRLKAISHTVASRYMRLSFYVTDDERISFCLRHGTGRKQIHFEMPLNSSPIDTDKGLLLYPQLVEETRLGAIWQGEYVCYKTLTLKTGYFVRCLSGNYTRCAGLPSGRKILQQELVKLYMSQMS